MSMSPEQENFESLQKLLALKRHEQPPPGYFNRFSDQVMIRIEAGETGRTIGERLSFDVPWLRRFWSLLDAPPILAGAIGAATCGLLIAGVMYSERADMTEVSPLPVSDVAKGPQIQLPGATPDTAVIEASAVESGVQPSLFQKFNETKKPWVVPASLNYSPLGTSN
jgi:hypothetical protein